MRDAGQYGIEDGWPFDPADRDGDNPTDRELDRRYNVLKGEADRHPNDAYGDLCRAKMVAMTTFGPS